METIKNISTHELVEELISREGVERAVTGNLRALYQKGYKLTKLYADEPERTVSENILILRGYPFIDKP